MNKLYLILIILAIAVSSVWSQPVTDTVSNAMIVNAYSREMFIQIVDSHENVIWQTPALASNDISVMLSTPKTGFFFINYKYSEAGDWLPFSDDSYDEGTEDYMINLQSGLVCCVVIDTNGEIDEHTLVLPETDSPVVCFCNLSNTKLNRMEIGTDYMNDFVAFTTDIQALGMTDFTEIDAGNYGLSWETPESGAKDEFTWISNEDDDTLKLLEFENNNIYVYCIQYSDASKGTLFNITP